MFDIVILVVIPLALCILVSLYMAHKRNILFKKRDLSNKVNTIADQPVIVHDSNHKKTILSLLMIPEKDDKFLKDCACLLKNNISTLK